MQKIYAHRGASGYYPENTMLSFVKAIEMKADGIEIDVQITKDGTIVICHDETVNRTTSGKGFIKDLTYDEILKFDAGQGEVIPTLDSFLELCSKNNTEANIELKNSVIFYAGLEEAVGSLLKKHNMTEKAIISSFNHKSMFLMKSLFPEIKTGLLYSNIAYCPEKYALLCNADAIHPQFSTVDKADIDNCHENCIDVNVWTVNNKEAIKAVLDIGVDIVITNFPDIGVSQLPQNR